ncbi:16S rRNA (guanine(527)-N(7))-methyltransferase RsmG [Epibacterium ulvae]|uniref:16S rRNA (guanine(527)-N(7))-methyltransferase RsmG n=1 Tax=Epibacterium ulvae TaxID=1156985 RepID=UPI0024913E64|nr:16S rRNA (guanine(527)-N(7))-methyltransferase RsmG [Epibacterium ulvae]
MNEDWHERLNVSRETFERLQIFEQTIIKWNPKINLVSKNSLTDLWTRHIQDSVQVFRSVDFSENWVDIGSGGGFPGVVSAILAHDTSPNTKFTLIESDQRKSAFLRNAARECGININVISKRIEHVDAMCADVLSARALADLSLLFEFCERHLAKDGVALFPKGQTWKKEVDNARERWQFDCESIRSETEPKAVILKIQGIARV